MDELCLGIVIPTRNRFAELGRCISAIERYNNGLVEEIIVIDDASDSAICGDNLCCESITIKLSRNSICLGATASRNRAVKELMSNVVNCIAFIDDDAYVDSGWFEVVKRELQVSRGAITGRISGIDSSIVARARQARYERRYANLTTGEHVHFFSGGNSVIWRTYFESVGGFPEVVSSADNLLVSRLEKIDVSCHFVSDMVVYHRNSKGLHAAIREAWRAGKVLNLSRKDKTAQLKRTIKDFFYSSDRIPELLNFFLELVFLLASIFGWLSEKRDKPS